MGIDTQFGPSQLPIMPPALVSEFNARIAAQIDKDGRFIISDQSIQAIAEAVVAKIKAEENTNGAE